MAFIKKKMKSGECTQSQLSERVSLNQATICRYKKGQIKTLSSGVKKLCDYAKISYTMESQVDPRSSDILMSAVQQVWDGSPVHEKQLAKAIRVLGMLGSR